MSTPPIPVSPAVDAVRRIVTDALGPGDQADQLTAAIIQSAALDAYRDEQLAAAQDRVARAAALVGSWRAKVRGLPKWQHGDRVAWTSAASQLSSALGL